jgi:hypothetical protein
MSKKLPHAPPWTPWIVREWTHPKSGAVHWAVSRSAGHIVEFVRNPRGARKKFRSRYYAEGACIKLNAGTL